ncbi:aspartate--tRNA ligase [Solicola gregarius]|uniref:Aspartate--tRNA(Asp/Asn) ligase n=1 Tax=Solicola gregarius TaxID=2908642 RepID=A0AA46TGG2_9ACTN|nr:aspartate--tRNA ligase [Solicola gregarius]UYM04810.1 aspartate--tRNA ligase [Solicola gregarius]
MIRTHDAGSLRTSDVGTQVTLAGWVARRRDHGGVAFIDLRDGSGVAQVVIREEEVAHPLRNEFCLKVTGQVEKRPDGNENPNLPSGEIEVIADDVVVLSESAPLPFPVEEHESTPVNEEVRLRYRYLDLRREDMARNLRLRADVTRIIREVMASHDFHDVETPYLTRSTPEGARDFLVPVRLQPGSWYALPQSPQLFKQLLMVAGMERYYQIARCFRDEDFRADRQPEFTQLDVEMSFVEPDDVLGLTEQLLVRLWRELVGYDLTTPIPRMTYAEAMRRFGIDRPDLRFDCELVDFTDYFKDTPFRVFSPKGDDWHVGAVVMPGGASQPRRQLDAWQEWAKSHGAKGLAYVLVGDDGTLGGPVAKNLSDAERDGLVAHAGASPGDCIFFAADQRGSALGLLASVRLEVGERCGLIDHDRWEFVWVTEAPMFERTDDGSWTAIHHPFTAPTREYADDFHDRPGEALSQAYDIVLNGSEIGGGSIRIHRSEMQQRVFDTIGLSKDEAESQFGFLLEAFAYGPPPHGGIALGLDRLCALLAGADSIRDVIAFPKTASGGDPLTGAPSPITPAQRKEAGIDAQPEPS